MLWMIVQKGWMPWLGTSCHGSTELDSSDSCPVWWNVWLSLCLQAVCSGHPADSSICTGKAHSLAVLTNWHILFLHGRVVPGSLSGACSFQPFCPVSSKEPSSAQSAVPGSSLPSWQVMVSTQQWLKCTWRIHQCEKSMEGLSGKTGQCKKDC